MELNVVQNNSAHTFSAIGDAIRRTFDQTAVVPTPGTDAAIVAQLRGELESGSLTSSGQGIHTNHHA